MNSACRSESNRVLEASKAFQCRTYVRFRLFSLWPLLLIMSVATLTAAGCKPPEDPAIVQLRQRLTLTAAPSDPISIDEAIKRASAGEPFTIVGKVGDGKGDAFEKGRAGFLISEYVPGSHSDSPDHDADGCPFCRAKAAKAPTVSVQFVDDSNKVLSVDAQRLFLLEKGKQVMVQGTGVYNHEVNVLLITATKIYVPS